MNPHRTPTRRRSVIAVAALATLALAACSSSKGTTAGSGPATSDTVAETTTTVVETTTTVAEPTTTVAETTLPPTTAAPVTTAAPATTAPAPACGAGNVPTASAMSVTTITGDWNGDGTLDQATSWAEPSMDWYIMIEVTGGASTTIAMPDPGPGFVKVLSRVDVDFSLGAPPGSNEDEFVAIVNNNAAGYNLGVFGVNHVGCGFQFDDGHGDSYILPIHASAAITSGMRCEGAAGSQFLVRLEASTSDGVTWSVMDVKIERPAEQTLADGVAISATVPAGSPALADYADATCGGGSILP